MSKAREFKNYREVVVGVVSELAREHEDIVFLDSDLSSCITSTSFEKEFPDRFINCGIAEANMAAVAAGMSAAGLTPFIHSFGCFASRRMYDQVFLSIGYAKRCVHIIGSDPGITAQYNGGTHMPFEDIALYRQIPDFIVIEPSDGESLYELTKQVYAAKKNSYIRTPRKGVAFRYDEGTKFEIGKGIELKDGKDVAIIATGAVMVDNAMEAYEILKKDGINATVVDLHTIKPLDAELILKVARRTGHVIVCENGRYAGGVGEGIAAFLAKNCPVKMDFMCVGERFGEVGNLSYLKEAFGFTGSHLASMCKEIIK